MHGLYGLGADGGQIQAMILARFGHLDQHRPSAIAATGDQLPGPLDHGIGALHGLHQALDDG